MVQHSRTALAAGLGTGTANTQACHIFHLGLAETGGSFVTDHCPHASKAGTGQCDDAGTANTVVFLVDRNGVMSLENKWLRSLTQKQMHWCVAVSANNFCDRCATTCGSISKWDARGSEFTTLQLLQFVFAKDWSDSEFYLSFWQIKLLTILYSY